MLEQEFSKERLCTSIDPDHAVATGATVLAAKHGHSPAVLNFSLQDRTSLSLGIQTTGDIMVSP